MPCSMICMSDQNEKSMPQSYVLVRQILLFLCIILSLSKQALVDFRLPDLVNR